MIANGFDIAVLEHHVSSSAGGFTNPYSQARVSYYGISGIPNSYFDGITNVLGGSTGTYSAFLAKYNQRIAVPSDFTASINGFNDGLDYTVVLNFEKVAPNSATNIVAHLVVTESGRSYGGSVFNYITRLMVPNQNGTPVDFSSNPNQSVSLDFSMAPDWVINNCEFVAFIQNTTTKEILQAVKVAVPDLAPLTFNNANCLAVNMVPVTNCAGEVSPLVTIANAGATTLTTLEVNYKVNNETLNVYNWTGSLTYGEAEAVELPAVSFNVLPENDLLIYTTNPNGNPDEDPMMDTTSAVFSSAAEAVPDIHFYLKLDDNPAETTWELKNSAGTVLYSGGPYVEAQQFVQETFPLTNDDCYTLYLYDSGGDGLLDPGFFALREYDYSLIYENNDFEGSEELVQFSVDIVSIDENEAIKGFAVSPNPFKDFTHVSFTLEKSQQVDMKVYNMIGEVIYAEGTKEYGPGQNTIVIDGKQMQAGIYFINMKIGENMYTKKVTMY